MYSSIDDVYEELMILYDKADKKGFKIGEALYKQSLFFVDTDLIVDNKAQNLIKKYTFCKKFNTPPYPSLQDTPAKLVDDFMLIDEEITAIKESKNKEVNNGTKI
jgi:hypothetical protein|tara:strand:- start:225 stop:539 length:315 start_codon:yes stop_codon:yes gene_type:complete